MQQVCERSRKASAAKEGERRERKVPGRNQTQKWDRPLNNVYDPSLRLQMENRGPGVRSDMEPQDETGVEHKCSASTAGRGCIRNDDTKKYVASSTLFLSTLLPSSSLPLLLISRFPFPPLSLVPCLLFPLHPPSLCPYLFSFRSPLLFLLSPVSSPLDRVASKSGWWKPCGRVMRRRKNETAQPLRHSADKPMAIECFLS